LARESPCGQALSDAPAAGAFGNRSSQHQQDLYFLGGKTTLIFYETMGQVGAAGQFATLL
jgi:hypothetical protein